jgi:hypothetical protein
MAVLQSIMCKNVYELSTVLYVTMGCNLMLRLLYGKVKCTCKVLRGALYYM